MTDAFELDDELTDDAGHASGWPEAVEDEFVDDPWLVYMPRLTHDGASRVLAFAEEAGLTADGFVVDPAESFIMILDRVSVEWLRAAMRDEESQVHSLSFDSDEIETVTPAQAREGMESFIADLVDFLEGHD